MKRSLGFGLLLTMAMVFSSAACVMGEPVHASNSELSTTNVAINGKLIEIPMIKSEIAPRMEGGAIQSSETIFIPDFSKITEKDNAEKVEEIKSRSVTPDSFMDNGQYILFNSTLSYNTTKYHAPNGGYYDLAHMISFSISRDIYTSAPFDGFRNPTATAMQIGPIDGPSGKITAEIYDQKKEYGTINFNQSYNVPDSWHGVIPDIVGFNVGVEYQIEILPSNGESYTLDHWHLV